MAIYSEKKVQELEVELAGKKEHISKMEDEKGDLIAKVGVTKFLHH